MDKLQSIFTKIKEFLQLMGALFLWLLPLVLILVASYIPKLLWNLSFSEYLEFLKILVWPSTLLIALFFFKKVVTYLFFSMDGFNFFGVKGTLKSVPEVIINEVNKKYLEKENEKDRARDMENLNTEIKNKETEIKVKEKKLIDSEVSAKDNLDLAKNILTAWKETKEKTNRAVAELMTENKRLKEIISGLPVVTSETNAVPPIEGAVTNDSRSEESDTNPE